MATPIANAEQVTPGWLTETLRRTGVLPQGSVIEIIPHSQPASFASLTWHLDVRYSTDAPPSAPGKLFLKCSGSHLAPGEYDSEGIQKEVAFYQAISPAMQETPAVPCFDAAYDPQTRSSHLLLLDVSATHGACPDPRVEGNTRQAVDRLALLHAAWWDHPRLGRDIGTFPDRATRQAEWADAECRTGEFLREHSGRLRGEWRQTYERVIRALPELYRRHETGHNLTLAHGDAHLGNFLFPRQPESQKTYLIDWQFWHPTVGGTDLAFMIATNWEAGVRRRLEVPLLQHYHEALLQRGVRGFSWDDCWNDYRLSVMLVSIFIPIWQWSIFKWEADLSKVEKSMTAFNDLQCVELL